MSKSVAVLGSDQVPLAYTVPVPGTLTTLSASAVYDGSAAGAFLPAVSMYDSDGNLIARATAPEVAAGGSAEVSWFPGAGLGGAGDTGLPVAFVDGGPFTLTPWGGNFSAVDWSVFATNDPTTFSWSAGNPSHISYAPGGVYRFTYEMQIVGSSWPAPPATVLNAVRAPGQTGATSQQFSLNSANADLYRGDPTVGGNFWGPTGEKVFNDQIGNNYAQLLFAYTGASSVTVELVGFLYRLGGKVF